MMRPWHIWTVFGASLALFAAATGWISWTVLELDRARGVARRQASLEENVRLALWRMESDLTPIIVRPWVSKLKVQKMGRSDDRRAPAIAAWASPRSLIVSMTMASTPASRSAHRRPWPSPATWSTPSATSPPPLMAVPAARPR